MEPPKLSEAEKEQLLEELAQALEDLRDRCCAEMVPLWLSSSRAAREQIGESTFSDLDFDPSKHFLALSKGARSRYRGLAAWRHAVLWQGTLATVEDRDYREATDAMYFVPFPADTPPYAWSQNATAAPHIDRFPTPTTFKNWAKEGCNATLAALTRKIQVLQRGDWPSELRSILLKPSVRPSVREVLKLEEIPKEQT